MTIKTTAKKKPSLNRKGILLLADDLIANAKKYDQDTFGEIEECGTVRCMAGQCYLREIGARSFNSAVKGHSRNFEASTFSEDCVSSGTKQLGIKIPKSFGEDYNPDIFSPAFCWPADLSEEYEKAERPIERVIVALKALSRTKNDGSIGKNPKRIYNEIPQLKELLNKK